MQPADKTFDRVNQWIKSSVTLKLIIITIITLLLLIPSSMVKNIIREREYLNQEAIAEVSSKWANSQQINGPILTIPLVYEIKEGDEQKTVTRYFHQLPEQLNIEGTIVPESLRRGIYEVVVYKSQLRINGSFAIDPKIDQANLREIRYDQAFLTVGISDLRGIEEEIQFNWDSQSIEVEPGANLGRIINSGITVSVPELEKLLQKTVDFEFNLNLQGSQNMTFIPLGGTTAVDIRSDWPAPSFMGNFLPDQREISEAGFTANWKVLQLNRNFPQSWIDYDQFQDAASAAFGVNLLLPLDDYQKSMRSVKYSIMTIALTFLTFFLIEILNKRKIHPFQYILVGLALCLFYVLLVSISEHTDFNSAFSIASTGIISMITLYSATIFKRKKLTLFLLVVLSGVYGFLFVTIQMQDYALLLGSIGLTAILAITMYLTRNVNWYKVNTEIEE